MTGQRNRVKLCNVRAAQGSGVPGGLPVRAACVCMCVDVCGRAFTAIAALFMLPSHRRLKKAEEERLGDSEKKKDKEKKEKK